MEFPKFSIRSIAESGHNGRKQSLVVDVQLDLVSERFDAGVLDRMERIWVIQIVRRPAIMQADGLITELYVLYDRIDRFSLIISRGHPLSPLKRPAFREATASQKVELSGKVIVLDEHKRNTKRNTFIFPPENSAIKLCAGAREITYENFDCFGKN
jgi:hypothetical protein